MRKLVCLLTSLSLLAGLFTSCEKPNENNGGGSTTEQKGLRIVDEENNDIEICEFWIRKKMTFSILNIGIDTLEWEIPEVGAEWVKGFSKESGKLFPRASEKIEVEWNIPDEPGEEAVIYVVSNVENKQLRLIYSPVEIKDVEDYTETAFGLNMEMVGVKGGEFEMGSMDFATIERPVRQIALSSYHIGKYEVTQAQWSAVMGTTLEEQRAKTVASSDYGIEGEGLNYPMYYVSWEDAQEFCKKLSEATGKKYVLPTEAMWEYAARGGVHKTKTTYAGGYDIEEVAWYAGNSHDLGEDHPDYGTHPVGTKKANALGIYDMSGNVMEWCSDGFDHYDVNDTENPQGPTGIVHVIRGGGWSGWYEYCRVLARLNSKFDSRAIILGFRVACLVE